MTVSVTSVVQERSPATLICTAVLTAPFPNDVTPVISWSKDGQLVHSSNELVITKSNVTATLIQSNLTILTLEISDSGSYSCQVVLHSSSTQSSLLPPTVSTVLLEVKGMHVQTYKAIACTFVERGLIYVYMSIPHTTILHRTVCVRVCSCTPVYVCVW